MTSRITRQPGEAQWRLADALDPMRQFRWDTYHLAGADDPHLTVAEEEQRFALLDNDHALTRPRPQSWSSSRGRTLR